MLIIVAFIGVIFANTMLKIQQFYKQRKKIVRYSNEHNEYRAMISALMTGFQDLRDPLFTVSGSLDQNSNPTDATVPLRKFINDDFNDYVHELKISSDFNLLNHFSYIMLGYEPD
jgi:esterase/lipase